MPRCHPLPRSRVLPWLVVGPLSMLAAGPGCVTRSDNPFARCATPSDCASGELCYRGYCIPDGVDGGMPDAPGADAPVPPPDAPDLDAPPDAGCPGAGVGCGTSMPGACSAGRTECAPGGGLRCARLLEPMPEACNTRDDDCDGATDEGADLSCFTGTSGCTGTAGGPWDCTGVCRPGIQRCGATGELGACEGEVLPVASPDGCSDPGSAAVDDDCDGMIDEDCVCTDGAMRSCYAGPAGTAGTGRCAVGTITCAGGSFGACVGEVLPRAEACDNAGIDDDCNGAVDDVAGTGVPCTIAGAMGVCADGVMSCSGGVVTCVGPTPRAERCDGTDDDCDGIVDDGFDLETSEDHCGACGRSCGAGRTCCGGECVSTDSDPMHCGDCPTTCSGGTSACCRGACRAPTAPECTGCARDCTTTGEACCSGSCVDFMTDAANCGGCGAMSPSFVCGAGQRCCGGTCVGDSDAHCGSCAACGADQQCCGAPGAAACVADDDRMNCHACGTVCGAAQTCCDLGCSNLLADVRNCGTCGNACPGATDVCSNGRCCPMGSYNSGGICCPTGTSNSNGVCCGPGLTGCSGACFDLQRDEAHCGACSGPGTTCSGLSPRCCNGACGLLGLCAD